MLIISLFFLCLVTVCSYDLPFFEAPRGSHYETGFAVGKHFSSRITEFIQGYDALHDKLRPFAETEKGHMIVQNFIIDNTMKYPQYVDELRGIAHGSNASLEDIWLINLRAEINGILNRNESASSPEDLNCMDIFLNDGTVRSIAHNEDCGSRIKSYAYLLKLNIIGEPSIVAYTYPGMLSGIAFGFNEYGNVITANSESPIDVRSRGVARAFLHRDYYISKSPAQIIHNTQHLKSELATGFAVNFGNMNDTLLYNLEAGPDHVSTRVIDQTNPRFAHFNLYQRLTILQHADPSSEHRKTRYDEFPQVTSKEQVLEILGDTKDPQYPIYRNAKAPDADIITSATAYFDFMKQVVTIYIENPKHSKPIYVMNIH